MSNINKPHLFTASLFCLFSFDQENNFICKIAILFPNKVENCFTKFHNPSPFSISNGLLATIGGTQPNTDLLVVYLTDGRVGVNLTPDSNGLSPGSTLITSSAYNDTLLHQCQVIFSSGQLRLSVDGSDRQLTLSKRLHNKYTP